MAYSLPDKENDGAAHGRDGWTHWKTMYVFFPRGVETGGPEALHQLVAKVRSAGREAYLVPLPGTESMPDVASYAVYDAPIRGSAPDSSDALIVAPEANIRALRPYKRANTVIWWLSIDFSSRFYFEQLAKREGVFSVPFLMARAGRAIHRTEFIVARKCDPIIERSINVTQSNYAWAYLFARLGIVSSMLTDYTSRATMSLVGSIEEGDRGRTIAYSPAKGGKFAAALKAHRPDLEWVAIAGMSKFDVVRTLKNAAVYIDLGHHPGKDRIPREAALCGAAVIVARHGAAAFSSDLPIPWEHKISARGDVIVGASATLDLVLADIDGARLQQNSYVRWIEGEEPRFTREAHEVFFNGRLGFDITGFDGT